MTIKTILNLVKNMQWKGIFYKFRKTILVFLVIPVVLFNLIITINYAGKINREIENNLNIAYLKSSMYIDEQFRLLNNAYSSMVRDNDLILFLISGFDEMNGIQATESGEKIKGLLNNVVTTTDFLKYVSVFSSENDYVISTSRSGYVNEMSLKWLDKYQREGKSDFVIPNGENELLVCHGINVENETIGLLVFGINKEELAKKLRLSDYKLDIGITLENTDGEDVFTAGDIGNLKKSDVKRYNLANESLTMEFINGRNNITSFYKTVIKFSTIYLVTSIILVLILSFLCTLYLYESISDILSRMDGMQIGAKSKVTSIGRVNHNVLSHIGEDEDIEKKLVDTLNALHSAQMTALQMQINPHFVFNVLNYANTVILKITRCDNDAIKIIVLLSDILQFAMEEPKYTATVAEEIKVAKKYIEIEEIKTGRAFSVNWEIDETALNCTCIKLFLQPIIENSIMHGVKNLEFGKGIIAIKIKRHEGKLYFTVSDNGRGIEREKLAELKQQLISPFSDFTKHIGLRNVNQRIKLTYGDEYGASIDSNEKGTTVTMVMEEK